MSRAKSLRRLAAQLSSLATLEAAVAHGVQALLETPPDPAVPILNQRGPTGLSVKSSLVAPASLADLSEVDELMVALSYSPWTFSP